MTLKENDNSWGCWQPEKGVLAKVSSGYKLVTEKKRRREKQLLKEWWWTLTAFRYSRLKRALMQLFTLKAEPERAHQWWQQMCSGEPVKRRWPYIRKEHRYFVDGDCYNYVRNIHFFLENICKLLSPLIHWFVTVINLIICIVLFNIFNLSKLSSLKKGLILLKL